MAARSPTTATSPAVRACAWPRSSRNPHWMKPARCSTSCATPMPIPKTGSGRRAYGPRSNAWDCRPKRRSPACPAACASASRWRAPWSTNPTCCCWTNRPTTWTSTASHGWKPCCATGRARPSSSPTTGASSTRWRPASSSSTAAACSAFPAIFRSGRSARRSGSKPSAWSRPASTSCWPRKKSGSARASRRAAPATKAACAGSNSCASNAPSAANASATSVWRWPKASVRASWSPNSRTSARRSATRSWCTTTRPPSCAATASASSAPTARARLPCSSCCSANCRPTAARRARAATSRWPISTRCAPSSTRTRRWWTSSAQAASGWRSAARAST
ncbi:Uncharacterised protein [Bordetella pertussis]|nr:Uncharacterised protein [Bordetella pertussis]CRD93301.1 Uncharacterised protein [Bordetella pertussis]CRE08356.1 Uncharacterised protein [Bordetella pertussis]